MTSWRKSSYSEGDNVNCVELAALGGLVGVRDSKRPADAHLAVGRSGFAGMVAELKRR